MLKRQIAVNSAIYLGFEVVNKSIPFILVAYFSNLFGAEEIGHFAKFMAVVGLLNVLTGISAHGAVSVSYFKIASEEFPTYVFNIIILLLLSSVAVLVAVFLFSNTLVELSGIPEKYLYLAVLSSVAQFVTQINLIIWQVKKQAFRYGLYQTLLSVTYGAATLAVVYFVEKTWQSVASAYVSTYISFGIISILFLYFRGYIKLKLYLPHIRDAAAFGIPLMPHVLAGWFFLGYNIFLIQGELGDAKAGIFNMAMQFSLVLNVIALALNKTFGPIAYELIKENSDQSKHKLRSLTIIGLGFALILGILVGVIGYTGIKYFMVSDFQESAEILPVLILSSVVNMMYLLVAVYLFYEKKTTTIAVVTFLSAIIHILLSNILLDEFNLLGIAYSLALVSIIKLILTSLIANKIYPLHWKFTNG